MSTPTKRSLRANKLAELNPNMFDNYRDFFIALHLNRNTAIMHLIGTLIGLAILPYALYTLKWWIFLIYFFFFYGFGFLSHFIFDGLVSRTAKEAPWGSFIYALEINLFVLTGKMGSIQKRMFDQYPFLVEIYFNQH